LRLPILIRFRDILHDRVNKLCHAFNQVSEELSYNGHYQVVYPVKVNQQRRVAEELLNAQFAYRQDQIGFEAGSKSELMAILALTSHSENKAFTIICNGYKDREYIRLALLGQKLGHRVFIVVEKSSELSLILEEAKKLKLKPKIGLRARLASIGKGKWQNAGGEKSKFGLSANQIMLMVQKLKDAKALDTLQLLHFHLGSQIANIRDIQKGLQECAQFYQQLRYLGVPISTVDIGGGLGIDYEGTRSRTPCSMNYGLAEYAYSVVLSFQEICQHHHLPHPEIISESGRALTAHHAVLVARVIESETPSGLGILPSPDEQSHRMLQNLWADHQALYLANSKRSIIEIYHDAVHAIDEVQNLFSHGDLSLSDRAQAEQIYMATCRLIRQFLRQENRVHRKIMDNLNEKLADKLFVNFSLFQSLPDIWGIDQIFPILPLDRIDHSHERRVIIQDITCDSDGRIDHYVTESGLETTLPLPNADGSVDLGFFLVGAYQEILGDMHNLFGDTDSVDVAITTEGQIIVDHPAFGDNVEKVLKYVNYSPEWLRESYQAQLERTLLSREEKNTILDELFHSLNSYTYLVEK